MTGRNAFRAVVITGASSGLGAALARAYAASGVILGLIGRNEARLGAVAADCRNTGAEVVMAILDVTDPQPLARWLLDFDRRAPVDLVIANAGTSAGPAPGSPVEGLDLATKQVRVNLLGVINTVEPLLPVFLERQRGRIAIVSSLAGYRGLPYSPGYSASKAGSRAYGEALRALLMPTGIGVSVVCPGFFSSPMTDRFKGPTPFLSSVESAAATIKRGLDKGRKRIVFPWRLAFGMRFVDLAPAMLSDAVVRAYRFHIVPGC